MSSPNKLSLHQLYDCKCPNCGGNIERLSLSQTENDDLQKAFNKAARWIFKQKKSEIQPDDLNDQAVQPLLNSINSVLQDGFNKGIEHRVPYIMKRDLRENIYVFSGAKTYAELKELSGLLLDGDGNIKPFYKFWQEVQGIHTDLVSVFVHITKLQLCCCHASIFVSRSTIANMSTASCTMLFAVSEFLSLIPCNSLRT